jgi:hypothetical protein
MEVKFMLKQWIQGKDISILDWPAKSPDLSQLKMFGTLSRVK